MMMNIVRLTLAAFALLAGAEGSAPAAPLTEPERQRLLEYLEKSRDELVATVKGLSSAQATFQPAADRWSILHNVEHLVAAEEALRGMNARLLAEPLTPRRPELAGREDLLIATAVDRRRKFQAPEAIRPSGRYPTIEAALEGFLAERNRMIEYVRTTQDALRDHVTRHPVLPLDLDGYQLIFGIPAHSDRHLAQIREVLASPAFPRN